MVGSRRSMILRLRRSRQAGLLGQPMTGHGTNESQQMCHTFPIPGRVCKRIPGLLSWTACRWILLHYFTRLWSWNWKSTEDHTLDLQDLIRLGYYHLLWQGIIFPVTTILFTHSHPDRNNPGFVSLWPHLLLQDHLLFGNSSHFQSPQGRSV